MPEVRVLCSAGITRHQCSYDPVRLPPGPPPENDVEAATLIPNGSPPITCITFPTCCAHYPGGSSGCTCRWLPHSRGLPQMAGGSASALTLSRPAQASHTLRPVGSLSRPRRPLSRGFSPAGYPTKPLVSYQIYRLLSGWNLPPLVIHAFGAHGQQRPYLDLRRRMSWPAMQITRSTGSTSCCPGTGILQEPPSAGLHDDGCHLFRLHHRPRC